MTITKKENLHVDTRRIIHWFKNAILFDLWRKITKLSRKNVLEQWCHQALGRLELALVVKTPFYSCLLSCSFTSLFFSVSSPSVTSLICDRSVNMSCLICFICNTPSIYYKTNRHSSYHYYSFSSIVVAMIQTKHACYVASYSLQIWLYHWLLLYRALEAACAAYASLNLSLLHFITLHNMLALTLLISQRCYSESSCRQRQRRETSS